MIILYYSRKSAVNYYNTIKTIIENTIKIIIEVFYWVSSKVGQSLMYLEVQR